MFIIERNCVLCLSGILCTVIAKVFRQADTEETGHVDFSYIYDLAATVLGGQNIKESEKSLIKFHSDSKKGIISLLYYTTLYACTW